MKTRRFKTACALLMAGAVLICPAQAAVREDFYQQLADMAAAAIIVFSAMSIPVRAPAATGMQTAL